MKQFVKLQFYDIQPDKVTVDIYEADEFDQFIIIQIDDAIFDSQLDHLQEVLDTINENGKKILVFPTSYNPHVIGIKEIEEECQ